MTAKAPSRMPDRYKNYRPAAPKAPPARSCTCHPLHGASTCLVDHPSLKIKEPIARIMYLRTPLMEKWAMGCLNDGQILYRGGKNQVIIRVSNKVAHLQDVVMLSGAA